MSKEIVKKVRDAGIVGAGGAGFPTHVKLDAKVEFVLANGAECEPLLRVDRQLMALQPGKIIDGLETVVKATGASKGIATVKKKYKGARAALEKEIKGRRKIWSFFKSWRKQLRTFLFAVSVKQLQIPSCQL